MTIFLGAYLPASSRETVEAAARLTPSARILPFNNAFAEILCQADLSISGAGINTCADVMAAGVRAIFIPSAAVADQCARARRMEALGAGLAVFPEDLNVDFLQRRIADAFHSAPARPVVPLDGVECTTRFMKRILKVFPP